MNTSSSSGNISGKTISFNSSGKISATITSIVGINVSYTVISSGTFDKDTNNGSVNVTTY